MAPKPGVVPLPWTVARLIAALAWLTNRVVFGGRAKLPGLLIPARLHARFKPLRYSNARIRSVLEWTPRYTLEEALDRCYAEASDLQTFRIGGEQGNGGADVC